MQGRARPRGTVAEPRTPLGGCGPAPRDACRRVRRSWNRPTSLAGMTPISGQSVLITGAAHGIGAETARRLAARGARVSLVGLGDLEAVAGDCPGPPPLPGGARIRGGSTQPDAPDPAVRGPVQGPGGIDTVFANAGIGAPGFVRTM